MNESSFIFIGLFRGCQEKTNARILSKNRRDCARPFHVEHPAGSISSYFPPKASSEISIAAPFVIIAASIFPRVTGKIE